MPALKHPNEAMLAAVLNQPMPPVEVERILEHLDHCRSCDRRQQELEPAISEYRRFRQRMAPQLPRPPLPWADIWVEMDRIDRNPLEQINRASRVKQMPNRRIMRPGWLSAIAAGILLAGLALWPHGDSLMRAETLLRKATLATSHSSARTRSHLRVKTRTASFIRPAVLVRGTQTDQMEAVRTRFEAAHYDWTDPLNPAALGSWRNSLANKSDKVTKTDREPAEYTLETSTDEGSLRDAALTFEAKDLQPVSGRFQFADAEWVEIAAVPDAPELPAAPGPAPAPATTVAPEAPSAPPIEVPRMLSEIELAEREVEVRAAIDRMAPGAGEPIGIETESGKVVVTIYNLAPQQEGQLRASLQGMEGVVIRSPDSNASPAGQTAVAAPFPAIDTSEAIVSRAHVLDQLARRFPPDLEARLSETSRATLQVLRSRQISAVRQDVETLVGQLSSTRPLSVGTEPSVPDVSASLTQTATAVQRLVTSIYAGGAGQVDPASVWPQLAAELSRLRLLTRTTTP